MANDTDPYQRPADVLARAGRFHCRTCSAVSVVLAIGMVAAGGWAVVQTQRSQQMIERYVVALDDAGAVALIARVGTQNWQPDDAFVLDFVRRYILNLRQRPADPKVLQQQMWQAAWASDAKLIPALKDAYETAEEQLKRTPVDVTELSANILNVRRNAWTVFARWTEVVDGKRSTDLTASIDVVYEKPNTTKVMERNPVGLWIAGFRKTVDVTIPQPLIQETN